MSIKLFKSTVLNKLLWDFQVICRSCLLTNRLNHYLPSFTFHLFCLFDNYFDYFQKQTTPLNDFSARGAPCPPTHKVFIQRDYSEGTQVRFQSKFPTELEGKVNTKDTSSYVFFNLSSYWVFNSRLNLLTMY